MIFCINIKHKNTNTNREELSLFFIPFESNQIWPGPLFCWPGRKAISVIHRATSKDFAKATGVYRAPELQQTVLVSSVALFQMGMGSGSPTILSPPKHGNLFRRQEHRARDLTSLDAPCSHLVRACHHLESWSMAMEETFQVWHTIFSESTGQRPQTELCDWMQFTNMFWLPHTELSSCN